MKNNPLTPGSSNRTAFLVARIAGLFAGGLGLYLAYGSIAGFFVGIRDSQSIMGIIGDSFFFVLVGFFAIWCIVVCYQSWRPGEKVPFRSLSAILAISFFSFIIPLNNKWATLLPGLTLELWESLMMLVAVVLASALYVSLAWWFSTVCSGERETKHIPEFLSLIICILLFGTSLEFVMEVAPKKLGYEYVLRFPWGILELVIPLTLSVLVWYMLRRFGSGHGKHDTTDGTP